MANTDIQTINTEMIAKVNEKLSANTDYTHYQALLTERAAILSDITSKTAEAESKKSAGAVRDAVELEMAVEECRTALRTIDGMIAAIDPANFLSADDRAELNTEYATRVKAVADSLLGTAKTTLNAALESMKALQEVENATENYIRQVNALDNGLSGRFAYGANWKVNRIEHIIYHMQ